jgi:hypothetical protein
MNIMTPVQLSLELLDRKFSIINDAPKEEVLLEACAFLEWIQREPNISPYVRSFIEEQKSDYASFSKDEDIVRDKT